MELQEARQRFIESWGTLGSAWGINRTMAQIHALLLSRAKPLCTDDIIEALRISRGNVNMNVRALIDWGLVHKHVKIGERKEFFVAEKDMFKVVQRIIVERKKRELEPMMHILNEIEHVEGDGEAAQTFREVIQDLKVFSERADAVLERLSTADPNWLTTTLLKMV